MTYEAEQNSMSKSTHIPSAHWHFPKRIAYVVSHSYPYSTNGYAVRTHAVARALTELGHEVLVINKPGRPSDIEGFPADLKVYSDQMVDGIRYMFLNLPDASVTRLRPRLRQAEKVLFEAFEVFRPGAVLAVSDWRNAEPAQYAAQQQGIPFFYEQRGFWELSRLVSDPEYAQTDEYALDQQYETRIAKAAQAVFTLNGTMRDEIARRGVPSNKIHLIPNGMALPTPVKSDLTRQAMGCQSKYLLGYIGSLNAYEGLEDLLSLVALLRGDGLDVDAMIVGSSAAKGLIQSQGDDPAVSALRKQAQTLGLSDHIHFIPQIPENEVGGYYALTDAIILPRRRTAVTELVPPIKPYAAATFGVPVFMTDLPPLAEIAQDIQATLFPEGDVETLSRLVRPALEQTDPEVPTLNSELLWSRRVEPMARLIGLATSDLPDLTHLSHTQAEAGSRASMRGGGRFNLRLLPEVVLKDTLGATVVAALGPNAHLESQRQARVTRLTRLNTLSELATRAPGTFVIDWAGLQTDPGEWEGLWSIDNMRLNRLVMDACRIGLDRGWHMQVIGPVHRAQAPLFRTVGSVLEEVDLTTLAPQGTPHQEVEQ